MNQVHLEVESLDCQSLKLWIVSNVTQHGYWPVGRQQHVSSSTFSSAGKPWCSWNFSHVVIGWKGSERRTTCWQSKTWELWPTLELSTLWPWHAIPTADRRTNFVMADSMCAIGLKEHRRREKDHWLLWRRPIAQHTSNRLRSPSSPDCPTTTTNNLVVVSGRLKLPID